MTPHPGPSARPPSLDLRTKASASRLPSMTAALTLAVAERARRGPLRVRRRVRGRARRGRLPRRLARLISTRFAATRRRPTRGSRRPRRRREGSGSPRQLGDLGQRLDDRRGTEGGGGGVSAISRGSPRHPSQSAPQTGPHPLGPGGGENRAGAPAGGGGGRGAGAAPRRAGRRRGARGRAGEAGGARGGGGPPFGGGGGPARAARGRGLRRDRVEQLLERACRCRARRDSPRSGAAASRGPVLEQPDGRPVLVDVDVEGRRASRRGRASSACRRGAGRASRSPCRRGCRAR